MANNKNLKSALVKSLKAEDEAVRDRFEKADSLLLTASRPIVDFQDEPQQDKVTPETKVIRDTFTMPIDDHALIATIQQRCLQSAVNANKSEIIRAGLQILSRMSSEQLVETINNLEKVKIGRPAAKP
ncbi:hypothetical protein IQ278_12045 [Tolypothrix sp. LEGE 11397]|uniref:hypothetical protein n=1 Tax=Tolypothrix sp. LEGE 11397 TaxID=2777971 RepID=UPI00187F5A05|nr:hypothetical protein [Tolypothrix sp. LEGE 11397]MBE9082845.1 hypothetical protein [Tolypothrix sp. LEGE 11397]